MAIYGSRNKRERDSETRERSQAPPGFAELTGKRGKKRRERMGGRVKLMVVCVIMACVAVTAAGTLEEDEKECAEQLANLAACIPYVSGSAKKPTKQCCDETEKVRSSKPKCLCVLIKESTDPSMGLPVNTTLALQMPSACNIDAKVSDCPSILKLPPDSPDAKIFKEASADASTTSASTSPSTRAASAVPESKANPSSNNGGRRSFGSANVVVVMVSVAWIFFT